MFTIGICDDGKNICEDLQRMLWKWSADEGISPDIVIWNSGEDLKAYLLQGKPLDILLLDIELLQMTGIEAGNFIRKHLGNLKMQIIYISGKASYALELFQTQPTEFLIKPITQEKLNEALETAVKFLEERDKMFRFQSGKDYYSISMGDILYLTSEGRKIRAVTCKGEYEFYGRLSNVEETLGKDFLKIHKSFIVNKMHVFHYAYDHMELVNGEELIISKAYRKKVRETILMEKE